MKKHGKIWESKEHTGVGKTESFWKQSGNKMNGETYD